jgi:hypothetical protein
MYFDVFELNQSLLEDAEPLNMFEFTMNAYPLSLSQAGANRAVQLYQIRIVDDVMAELHSLLRDHADNFGTFDSSIVLFLFLKCSLYFLELFLKYSLICCCFVAEIDVTLRLVAHAAGLIHWVLLQISAAQMDHWPPGTAVRLAQAACFVLRHADFVKKMLLHGISSSFDLKLSIDMFWVDCFFVDQVVVPRAFCTTLHCKLSTRSAMDSTMCLIPSDVERPRCWIQTVTNVILLHLPIPVCDHSHIF